ncbi:protein serine/threonine kinase, putative [Entamoeba invadens IP1]|uniref:Protein serine/threonine kinase, putative n=1 Tax=Entamoeba invadens IP1 TaxID=370355 RepID=A0A0A1U8B1_ENTIV|nr:protein serine/threonine kinase, putative [Entamoeba invadens IP1]ELP88218.1 protein serine/threonine kinase, putative [Entamoeba invadens IP1]|eukprot:XP_004254989.1 protein serine/threonine kinase, putative [Entamoeba invadens IP1]
MTGIPQISFSHLATSTSLSLVDTDYQTVIINSLRDISLVEKYNYIVNEFRVTSKNETLKLCNVTTTGKVFYIDDKFTFSGINDVYEITSKSLDLEITSVTNSKITMSSDNSILKLIGDFSLKVSGEKNVIDVTTMETSLVNTGANLLFSNKGITALNTKTGTALSVVINSTGNCQAGLFGDSFQCILCNTGYFVQDGVCYQNNKLKNCETYDTNGKCLGCKIGFGKADNTGDCLKCSTDCLNCLNNVCLLCSLGNQVKNGVCEYVSTNETNCVSFEQNRCYKCNKKYNVIDAQCTSCGDNTVQCDSRDGVSMESTICELNFKLENKKCINSDGVLIANNGVVSCEDTYYLSSNTCLKCNDAISNVTNCGLCNNKMCIKCLPNTIPDSTTSTCKPVDGCQEYLDNSCVNCGTELIVGFNICRTKKDGCYNMNTHGDCLECDDEHFLSNGNCETKTEASIPSVNCIQPSSKGCNRCEPGYFYDDSFNCQKCSSNCEECFFNSTYCTSCNGESYLYNNLCHSGEELKRTCKKVSPIKGGGCYICKDGFYRGDDQICRDCDSTCETCNQKDKCIFCKDEYFMSSNTFVCKLKSEMSGCTTKINSLTGCAECDSGYFLFGNECFKCGETCATCKNKNDSCLSCGDGLVLNNSLCVPFNQIKYCTSAHNSRCTKCSFWHDISEGKESCETKAVWWVIVIIVILSIVVLIVVFVVIGWLIWAVSKKISEVKRDKAVCVFTMDKSNVRFVKSSTIPIVSMDKSELVFDVDGPIHVNKENRMLLCVGNNSNGSIKVQFTSKTGQMKYEMKVSPNLVLLRSGKACEFEVTVLPLCTSVIKEDISLVVSEFKTGQHYNMPIHFSYETEISTSLDPDELIEDKKLGEGSFGIVFKGTFRGYEVAIKKMKNVSGSDEELDEFEKEVVMLDKFRSDYIIHFYGAVFIPNKICMVTEYAEFGSLNDMIQNKQSDDVSIKQRIKIMTDGARGIEYLHLNGVLHRDVKPDNMLVVSLGDSIPVNAKLTDFGSSRNVNTMMTNMTFTKGIGTPSYMAPEVLQQEHYKMASDVYSFAITMYECFVWGEAYPKSTFKFPWEIPEFVTSGKRLARPEKMDTDLYNVIDMCWSKNPVERMKIEDVVKALSDLKIN